MSKSLAKIFIGMLLTSLLSGTVQAAVVVLANGDRLSGRIISETGKEITLQHKVLGLLKIPRQRLSTIERGVENQPPPATEAAARAPAATQAGTPSASIETRVDDEKITGRKAVDDNQPGTPLKLNNQDTARAAARPQSQVAKGGAGSSRDKMTPKLMGLFGSRFLEGWKRHFAFGFSGESGDDESTEWHIALDSSYKDEADRISLTSAYYYETEDHKKDTSKGHVNLIRDWLQPDSPWFKYAYLLYEHDDFKSWKNRYSVSGGTGYDFIEEKFMNLNGRVGLGLSRSFGSEDKFETEGQIGMEWDWNPLGNKKHLLSFRFITYPILNDFGEYRTWCQGKWKIDLDLFKGLSYEMGFEHEYESRGEMDVEDEAYYDLLYFGRLGIDF